MKKLIYILLGLFALVSCIDDQSDLGGRRYFPTFFRESFGLCLCRGKDARFYLECS